jgi:hypothetical protein
MIIVSPKHSKLNNNIMSKDRGIRRKSVCFANRLKYSLVFTSVHFSTNFNQIGLMSSIFRKFA